MEPGSEIVSGHKSTLLMHLGGSYLSHPESSDGLVKPSNAFLRNNTIDPIHRPRIRIRNRALHPNLHRLERTQRNIRQQLRARRPSEVDARLVLDGVLRPREVRVRLLEVLVPAVLESSLRGVAEEGRGPAGEDAADAFAAEDLAPGLEVGGVEVGGYLAAGFDEVEGRDGGVGEALQYAVS